MSSYVDKDYFYYLRGRELLLYKLLGSRNENRITQSGVLQQYQNELVYPDEDIANGLRVEYTKVSEPFVSEALETTLSYASGTNISIAESNNTDIVTTTSNFWDTTSGFAVGDKIRIKGSSSNDGDHTIVSFQGTNNVILRTSSTLTTEASGQRIIIQQIPKEVSSPDSTSHINLNKMLSLAVVDYCNKLMMWVNNRLKGQSIKKQMPTIKLNALLQKKVRLVAQ